MRNKTLSTFHTNQSLEIDYPHLKWYESESNVLNMYELTKSNREIGQLYQEIQEENFLLGKTPHDLPDHWEEEE